MGEALEALYTEHGELRGRLSDDGGGLRRFVNVYIGGEDIRFLDGLDTARLRRRRADDPPGRRGRLDFLTIRRGAPGAPPLRICRIGAACACPGLAVHARIAADRLGRSGRAGGHGLDPDVARAGPSTSASSAVRRTTRSPSPRRSPAATRSRRRRALRSRRRATSASSSRPAAWTASPTGLAGALLMGGDGHDRLEVSGSGQRRTPGCSAATETTSCSPDRARTGLEGRAGSDVLHATDAPPATCWPAARRPTAMTPTTPTWSRPTASSGVDPGARPAVARDARTVEGTRSRLRCPPPTAARARRRSRFAGGPATLPSRCRSAARDLHDRPSRCRGWITVRLLPRAGAVREVGAARSRRPVISRRRYSVEHGRTKTIKGAHQPARSPAGAAAPPRPLLRADQQRRRRRDQADDHDPRITIKAGGSR